MTSQQSLKIGFIGLGIMGHAMARNAKKAGYSVVVTNRTLSRSEDLKPLGIEVVSTPRECAERVDILIIMVTGPDAIKDVCLGSSGVFKANVKGKMLIQMSTIDVATTLSLSNQAQSLGMNFLDCPVTGSKKQVEEAQLILLAGGNPVHLQEAEPLLKALGKAIVYAGEVGQGTALKLCMNLIVAQMTSAICESVALAKIQGLNPQTIFDVLNQSPALQCGYFKIKETALMRHDFSPAFSLSNMLKDVRFIDAIAKEKKLPLPVTQAVRFLMEAAQNDGLGDQDLTVISKVLWPKHLSDSGV